MNYGKRRTVLLFPVILAFAVMIAAGCYFIVSIHQNETQNSVTIGMNEAEKTIRAYLREPRIAFNSIYMALQDMLDRGESKEVISDYLKQASAPIAADSDGLEGFVDVYGYILDEMVSGTDFDFGENYIPQQRPWYQLAIQNDGAEYTEPYPELGSEIPIISLTQTLTGKTGEFYGVLALDIEMSWLAEYVESLKFADGGYILVVNSQMVTLVHPKEQYTGVGMNELGDSFAEISKMLRANESVAAEHIKDVDATNSVAFFKRLYNDWFIGLVIPNKSYYSVVYSGIIGLIVCGTLLAAAISVILLRFTKADNSQTRKNTEKPVSTRILLVRRFVIFSVCLFVTVLIGGSTAFILSMREIIRENKGNDLSQLIEIERNKLEASVNTEISLVLKLGSSPLI